MTLVYADASFAYAGDNDGDDARQDRPAAVSGVNLAVAAGAFMLLTGRSGSGKSTLVRMANGLIPHFHAGTFRGAVTVDGIDTRATAVRELAATVGLVFQNTQAQLFNATVERELAFGPRNQGLPRAEIAMRVAWAAERTGVTHLLTRPTHRLSGGECARVAIASVLTMRPPLLVLDEPSAALDPMATAALWALLHDLNRDGASVIVAEHRAEPAWEYDPTVAVMRQGRLVFTGPTAAALRTPLCPGDLPLPCVARLFAEAGLPERPATVAQAAAIVRARRLALRGCPDPASDAALTPGEPLLDATGVTYACDGSEVLRDIGFQLRRGECVALVGANGAGKTTLLRLVAGLAAPLRGRIANPRGEPIPRATIGMLLQNATDALFCRTVREEIAYGARLLGRYDADWIAALIDRFALAPLLDRAPLSLSDGERRRVALAASLGHRPEVMLLDEPTAGQDAPRRDALAETIATLRAAGAAALIATHDLTFAAAHCPRWLVLVDGALAADAPPAAVLGDAGLLARARLLPTPLARLATALGAPYPGARATLVAAEAAL